MVKDSVPQSALKEEITMGACLQRVQELQESVLAAHSAATSAELLLERMGLTGELKCGVSGVVTPEGRWNPPDQRQPLCGIVMATNCSVSYRSMQCPEKCPFLAPSEAFSCLFECVEREQCSRSNVNRALPNPVNHICEKCDIEGCQLCSSNDLCEQCFPRFQLMNNGTQCVFQLDLALHLEWVALGFGVLLFLLFSFCGLWRCIKGPHPNKRKNMESIMHARRHRHLVKVQEWSLRSGLAESHDYYNLTVDLHRKNLLGVGLSLFYNGIVWQLIFAIFVMAMTMAVWWNSTASQAIIAVNLRKDLMTQIEPPLDAPAIVLSPLTACRRDVSPGVRDEVSDFARSNFWTVGGIYVTTFIFSLLFAFLQKWHTLDFDRNNCSSSDFVVRVTGLDKKCTDEEALRLWLQQLFRAFCPGNVERGFDDEGLPHPSTPIEVYGVSICYDWTDKVKEVQDSMVHFMETAEKELDQYAESVAETYLGKQHLLHKEDSLPDMDQVPKAPPSNNAVASNAPVETKEAKSDEARLKGEVAKVCQWFSGPVENRLRSNGDAFVVFRYISDRDLLFDRYSKDPQQFLEVYKRMPDIEVHRTEPQEHSEDDKELGDEPEDHQVDFGLHRCYSEPPTIQWENLGVTKQRARRKRAMAGLVVIACIGLAQLTIIYPYAKFIVWPYAAIGSSAGGVKMMLGGIVLAVVNTLLSNIVICTAASLPHRRQIRTDSFVLISNVSIMMLNTLFNIYTMVISLSARHHAFSPDSLLSISTLQALHAENELAQNVFQMMAPGVFFVGHLTRLVSSGVLLYVIDTAVIKMIYVWQCMPKRALEILKLWLTEPPEGEDSLDVYPRRNAEKGFEPAEIALAEDYAAFIINPTVCCIMLFLISPYVWRIWGGLLVWAVFYYFYCRYKHLRFCKARHYSTARLDSLVLVAWGVPLSILAAAWCLWALRSEKIASDKPNAVKWCFVLLSFCTSLCSWFLCVYCLVNPFRRDQIKEAANPSIEQVQDSLVFSWFNCNPVFVLKCFYYWQNHEGPSGFFFFQDRKGVTPWHADRRKGHPIACGADPDRVRFYEIGKEYLLLKDKKQQLAALHRIRLSNTLEFETYMEHFLQFLHRIYSLFRCKKKKGNVVEEAASYQPLPAAEDMKTPEKPGPSSSEPPAKSAK